MKGPIAKCLETLDKDLKVISYFPFLDNIEGVVSYLKSSGYGLKQRLRIQSQFSQKKNIRKQRSLVIEAIKSSFEEKSLDNPFKRAKALRNAKRIKSRFWQRMLELPIALRAKNRAWTSRLKSSLCQESPYIQDIKGWNFTQEEVSLIKEYFEQVLSIYKEDFKDDEELRILAQKLSFYGRSIDFKAIASRFNADWSLSELRENFKNPYLRNKYFDFWFLILMNRTSSSELNQKIRQSLTSKVVKRAKESQYWVFEYFFPSDKDLRSTIVRRLNEQWKMRDRTYRFHILKSLANPAIKGELSKVNRTFKRALFQIERQYYSELLTSGEATHFAFYQLTKLGDKSSKNLWWLIF